MNNPFEQKGASEAYLCNITNLRFEQALSRAHQMDDGTIGHSLVYELEPADPRTGYSVLEVKTTFQRILDPSVTDEHATQLATIHADVEAKSLLTKWRSTIGAGTGVGPGIGQIAGPRPTDAELANLREQHTRWCRFLVNQADEIWSNPGRRAQITDTHRQAANFLQLKHSSEYPWIKEMAGNRFKDCIACQDQIPVKAFVCRSCRRDLVDYCVEKELDAPYIREQDPDLAELVSKQRKRLAAQKNKKKEVAAVA